ncbi:MAG: glycoside hydrolase family 2 [Clostridiales bacterium]|nr:glycoside hydrolase family 2 [Clostridiales bacterium]
MTSALKTRWSEKINKDCPLAEYPRPQLVRKNWSCLNGQYDYAITASEAETPVDYDGKILVPFSFESALSGVRKPLMPDSCLWYRRFFSLDESFNDKNAILHFGAVDWQCRVYINGKPVGEHTGGYCAFFFDITAFLKTGENELVVRVYDPTDAGWQQRGKQVMNPRGIWYTATSGIWQTVWLEPVDSCYIHKIKLLPDIDTSTIQITTTITAGAQADNTLIKAIVCENGKQIISQEITCNASITIPNLRLWSPESPFLYDLHLELYKDGTLCDCVESYFGMRKFSVAMDSSSIPRLFLNNKPYFQNGLLDQGYWSDGLLTPPSDEAMIYDIQSMKDLGFNMLRKHIKIEPLRWYYHCDRLGMIVWQDMISGGAYIGNFLAGVLPILGIHVKDNDYKRFKRSNPAAREQFKSELFEMIEGLYNTVSIGCWVPFNEGWGQFDAKEIAGAVMVYDSSRVVDHASGWHDQGGEQLQSVHRYIFPVKRPKPDARPFVLSEFGGYSRVVSGHVWNIKKCFGYRMFKDEASLTKAYKKLMERQIIPLVKKGLSATVYTQVSDVENEVNGILTYDREIMKLDAHTVKALNEKLVL